VVLDIPFRLFLNMPFTMSLTKDAVIPSWFSLAQYAARFLELLLVTKNIFLPCRRDKGFM